MAASRWRLCRRVERFGRRPAGRWWLRWPLGSAQSDPTDVRVGRRRLIGRRPGLGWCGRWSADRPWTRRAVTPGPAGADRRRCWRAGWQLGRNRWRWWWRRWSADGHGWSRWLRRSLGRGARRFGLGVRRRRGSLRRWWGRWWRRGLRRLGLGRRRLPRGLGFGRWWLGRRDRGRWFGGFGRLGGRGSADRRPADRHRRPALARSRRGATRRRGAGQRRLGRELRRLRWRRRRFGWGCADRHRRQVRRGRRSYRRRRRWRRRWRRRYRRWWRGRARRRHRLRPVNSGPGITIFARRTVGRRWGGRIRVEKSLPRAVVRGIGTLSRPKELVIVGRHENLSEVRQMKEAREGARSPGWVELARSRASRFYAYRGLTYANIPVTLPSVDCMA